MMFKIEDIQDDDDPASLWRDPTERTVSTTDPDRGLTAPACIKQGRFLGTVTGSLQRCAGRSAGQDNRSPGNSSM